MENSIHKMDKTNIKDVILYTIMLTALLTIVWLFMKGECFDKQTILYCIVIIVALGFTLIVYFFRGLEINFYKYAIFCLMVLGILSLFIQPILNIPDEATHYARAEMVSRGILFVDYHEQSHETIQATYDLMDESQKIYSESEIQGLKINHNTAFIEHVASSNLSISYIPQAIGIFVAKILNLDLIWSMWLGRFLNLVCYSFMVGLSLKLAGDLKFPLFFVSALPISIQQAASLSPDAIINGGVFLLIGYFIYLYRKDAILWKNLMIFLLLGLLVITSKVTNVFFSGLILLLPLEKDWKASKSIFIKIIFIMIFIICGVTFYIYTTQFPVPDVQKVYLDSVGVDSSGQIHYILAHLLEWFRNFGNSLIENCFSYMSMLNTYGWLNYGYSLSTIVMLVMFGKICFAQEGLKLSGLNKTLLVLMIIGNYCFTCLALYITWTPVGSPNIDGVQGRYFIPLIAVLILLLGGKKRFIEDKETHEKDMLIILAMVGAMLIKTVTYYY